jgi:hypothetical protein
MALVKFRDYKKSAIVRTMASQRGLRHVLKTEHDLAERETNMDWIEQLFGISPDGGDGTTEAMIAVAVGIAIAVVLYVRGSQLRTFIRNLLA